MKSIELEEGRMRVVITGIGAIMSGGVGKGELWDSCLKGVSNIREIKSFDTSSFPIRIAGEIPDEAFFHLVPEERLDKVDRFAALAMVAAREALEDSGLDPRSYAERIGVYVGSGYSGRKRLDEQNEIFYRGGVKRVHPRLMQNIITNAASGEVAIYLGLKGANLAYSDGYSSGSYAVSQAYNSLKLNPMDAILVGGAEAPILPLVLEEIKDLGEMAMSRHDPARIIRPFDSKREGFVISEGSCFLVLESLGSALSRNAHIYAELKGYGLRYDRLRRVDGGRRTQEMAMAMASALKEASLSPERVDYINASGLSTRLDDVAETLAIKQVFGPRSGRIPVSSIKPVTGYAIAASEIAELSICALALERGIIPPTINLENPDEECDLDYVPNHLRESPIRVALSNTFGIDGNYASIVMEKYEG